MQNRKLNWKMNIQNQHLNWKVSEEDCPWCAVPVGTTEKWFPFCSRKCAEADARDARETEADKWAMRYEI